MKLSVRINLLQIIYLLLIVVNGYAADFTIVAQATPTEVNRGDSFVYQVEVSGSSMTLPQPEVEIPGDFSILSGPNSSTNIQYVNGAMTASRSLTYQLIARNSGVFTIPAPTVTYKRKIFKGNAVTIVVTDGGAPGGSTQSQPPSAPSTPSTKPRSSGRPPQVTTDKLQSIFLDVSVEPKEVYFQQPITVTYTLYFRDDVRTFDIKQLSSTEGFWTEAYPAPNPPNVFSRTIRGQQYNAAMIHRLILFPTRTGELTIGPMEVVCQVRSTYRSRRQRSLFDSFFDSGFDTEQKMVDSDPVTVTIKPLPQPGRPADFDDVVGNYRLSATLDRDSVETNESVTLTVKISGEGNIGFLPEPKLVIPPDIQRYDPEVQEKHSITGDAIKGYKTFTYLLIPRRAGLQKIQTLKYSYFNPVTEKYTTLTSGEINLHVRPASGWAAYDADTPQGSREEVRSLATDIRYIHDASRRLHRVGPPIQERVVYQLAYLAPLAIIGLAFYVRRKQDQLESDPARQRSRKAAKRALNALKEARIAQQQNKLDQGFTALVHGVFYYFADRVSIPAAELNEKNIQDILSLRKIENEKQMELLDIIHRCNTARFTPDGMQKDNLNELIRKTQTWILAVDRFMDRKPLKSG